MNEIFTFLDLEMNQPCGHIIQVGAVIGNIVTGEVLEKYSEHTKDDCPISEYITNLTGITQKDIDQNGIELVDAYIGLAKIHVSYNSFMNPVTWGGGDSYTLKDQLNRQSCSVDWVFGRRHIDAKTLFQAYRFSQGLKPHGGLANSMRKFDLSFVGAKHNALDDSYNTFRIFQKLLSTMRGNDK